MASIDAVRNEEFDSCWESGQTGLTPSWMLIDNEGGVVYAASTVGIIETPAGSGVYCTVKIAPPVIGSYSILWSEDGSYDEDKVTIDTLVVHSSVGSIDFGPLLPADITEPVVGPCGGWTTVEDIADCCGVEVGSSTDLFEDSMVAATQVLFEASGRLFNPGCERVVRPRTSGFQCGVQILSRGYVIAEWDGETWSDGLSRALMPNYPVTEILDVKIDGVTIDADEYRLDGWMWLTRKAAANGNSQAWPLPQRLDRDSDQDATFEVTYSFGQNPPAIGSMAAAELACEIYKSCPGNEGIAGDCKLPKNATRITRTGVTIELDALYFDKTKRRWMTGMKKVDLFLNTYNPYAVRRRPLIWSPDNPQPAVEVGTTLGS